MSESLDNHLVHGRRQRPDGPSPIDVISVQSQLVYGHAGNSAAVPPMRALGVRVAEIPTVLLSNAPFYDTTRGRVLPADGDARLGFYIEAGHILFKTERHTLISRLLDGEFIRYNQIFNEDFSTLININRQQLLMSLERALLLTRDNKNSPVKLSIKQETVVITSNTEMGASYDEITADIDGTPLDIAFNPKYLVDALRVIDDENVILTFTGALSPCIIKGASVDFYKYLILPLRTRN